MAAAEAVALLEALRAQVAEVAAHGREMLRRVRGGQLDTKEGVSLLELRSGSLLGYLQDLALLVCAKGVSLLELRSGSLLGYLQDLALLVCAKGVSLLELRSGSLLGYLQDLALLVCAKARGGSLGAAGGARERLLETRVVLEKLRPLEQRLKYHLEKLLRAAASGGRGAEDPLSFRPAPSNMAAQDEEEEEEQGQGGGAKAPGLGGGRRYVPPRLVPVSCDPAPDPESRSRSRLRLRALSSAALRELRQELGEGPLEEGEGLQPPHREEIQRRRWEESMLQRLSAPCRRRRGAGLGLDDVTKFGAFPALLGANQESSEPPQKKRKKPKMGKKKGRKGFRRRR